MLCTNSQDLLFSVPGKMSLNFRATSKPPQYNPTRHNLLITWDIFMQDYRSINMDTCTLISLIPANDQFWMYFTENIAGMTANQKIRFMDV